MKEPIFPDRIEENPENIKQAEIVIGIPSFNEVDSIQTPTTEVAKGLKEFFPDKKSVIINCDNSSTDGTKEAFLGVSTDVPKIYLSTPEGVKGKGNNLLNLCQRSLELGAKAIVTVDADIKSITPRWVHNLTEPLFKGHGFVSPIYVRHKYEGTITNNIAYPLTRALYGRRVRQPIGGDFGISAQLAKILLEEPEEDYISKFGIDIWMTTIAITSGLRICQSFLGGPKIHKSKEPGASIIPIFKHNVGTIFLLMEKYEEIWKKVRWSKPSSIFGYGISDVTGPQTVKIDLPKFYQKFHEGFPKFEELWKEILHQDVLIKLQEVKESPYETFEFPMLLWAQILYDFAVAFKRKLTDLNQLMESLSPLYFGQTCSYAISTAALDSQQVEEYIDDQCRIFEETKPYLHQRWEES